MYIVLAYDISDDRRRTKLYKKLKNFGVPVQLSVFEFNLTPSQKDDLIKTVLSHLKSEEDRFSLYVLCEECRKKIERFSTTPRKQPFDDEKSSIEV